MPKRHTLLAALAVVAVGAGGVYAYERWMAATIIAPGAVSLPVPSSGTATLALPRGAKSWTTVNVISTGGATQPQAPASPTTHLQVPAVKGEVVTITWVDSTGSTEVSIITFS